MNLGTCDSDTLFYRKVKEIIYVEVPNTIPGLSVVGTQSLHLYFLCKGSKNHTAFYSMD